MSWQTLLESGRVKRHTTSAEEISDLPEIVERDLKDAHVEMISADRRFATAYNAVLQLAKMVIACSGYRVSGLGHHQTTFDALELALGPAIAKMSAYFDTCRRKTKSSRLRFRFGGQRYRTSRVAHSRGGIPRDGGEVDSPAPPSVQSIAQFRPFAAARSALARSGARLVSGRPRKDAG